MRRKGGISIYWNVKKKKSINECNAVFKQLLSQWPAYSQSVRRSTHSMLQSTITGFGRALRCGRVPFENLLLFSSEAFQKQKVFYFFFFKLSLTTQQTKTTALAPMSWVCVCMWDKRHDFCKLSALRFFVFLFGLLFRRAEGWRAQKKNFFFF